MATLRRFRVALSTLGCKSNQYDSAELLGRLDEMVFALVPFNESADAYVVNSCTVTQLAERQSRKLIYQAKRCNPDSLVILCGCYATMTPEALRESGLADAVVAREDSRGVLDILTDAARSAGFDPLPVDHAPRFPSRSRPFLKVQDGCEAACAYCIIPRVRGAVRSSPVETVLSRLAEIAAQGAREVVLTGIHVGQWGRDLPGRPGLHVLLDAIGASGEIPRVRLSSLESLELTDAVLECLARHTCFCPHLHIPLQSGSDTILKAMRRPYRSAAFLERISRARDVLGDIGLGLDLIVGFPGETEALFTETLTFLDKLPYHYLHVFPYSERPDTPAAAMPEQVPVPVRRQRAAELIRHGEAQAKRQAATQVGKTLPVLLERGLAPDGCRKGFSDTYYEVHLDPEEGLEPRQIVQTRITGLVPDSAVLLGRRCV